MKITDFKKYKLSTNQQEVIIHMLPPVGLMIGTIIAALFIMLCNYSLILFCIIPITCSILGLIIECVLSE